MAGPMCKQCKVENPLGRMFCIQCGAKLQLDGPPQPSALNQAKATGVGLIFKLVRFLVLAVLLGLLGLLVWPLPLSGDMGASQDAMTLYRNVVRMDHAIQKNEVAEAVVTEGELNAYLDEIVRKQQASETSSLQLSVSNARIEMEQDYLVVLLRAHLGPLPLSYQITGTPVFGQGSFSMNVREARFGHLPMPGGARGWLAGRMALFFERLTRERSVLENLDHWQSKPGVVKVFNDPNI